MQDWAIYRPRGNLLPYSAFSVLNFVDLMHLNMVKCIKWSWNIPKYLINEHVCSEGFVESYEWLEIWYTFCGCRFHEGPAIISKISLKCFILLQNISEIFIVKPRTVLTYWTLFSRPKHESFSHSYCPTIKCTTVPREQKQYLRFHVLVLLPAAGQHRLHRQRQSKK